MRTFLILVVAGLTSVAGLVTIARGRISGVAAAAGIVLEVVGATVVFFVANVALGVTLVLVSRLLTPFYTTLYEMTDITLLIISLLQAVTLTTWRQSR